MQIAELIAEAHETAKSKGWWEDTLECPERTFGDQIALMHSELSEALEEFRKYGIEAPYLYAYSDYPMCPGAKCVPGGLGSWEASKYKPEGIAAEFADVLIRIADTCGRYGIDLEEAIAVKMQFNKSRPHKHGGKKI